MARKRNRLTASQKAEIVSTFYGINPRTLDVESVSVTRDGHMTKWGKGGLMHTHYSAHGNPHKVEISIVYGLIDMFEVHPLFENQENVKQKLAALKQKGAQMRAEKEGAEINEEK
jgi:hypothetical protein